jgi:hypothetical protein
LRGNGEEIGHVCTTLSELLESEDKREERTRELEALKVDLKNCIPLGGSVNPLPKLKKGLEEFQEDRFLR